jgi:hypothetical protein
MSYNPGIVGTQSTSWSQKSEFGRSFSQNQQTEKPFQQQIQPATQTNQSTPTTQTSANTTTIPPKK